MHENEMENATLKGAEDKKKGSLLERLANRRKEVEEQMERHRQAVEEGERRGEAAREAAAAPAEPVPEEEPEAESVREEHLTHAQLVLMEQLRDVLLQDEAEEREYDAAADAAEAAGEEPWDPAPKDARLLLQVEDDEMSVWGILLPPKNGGNMPDRDLLRDRLKEAGVCNGIVNLDAVVLDPQWKEPVLLAEGQRVQDGANGIVEDQFPREVQFHLEENEKQTVDFKQLNWLRQVKKGAVICKLIPATAAVPGKDVRGKAIQGRDGVMPPIPQGMNTEVSTEQSALVATCDGQLSFRKGAFHVEQVLQIAGDVDNSSGNLDVIGNVVIGGNVYSGFSVHATGDIMVKGQVEGAYLKAGGNIQVSQGVKGAFKGKLEAKGSVQAKFMENCQVNAGGSVTSDSVINSQVSSGDRVTATTGKGVIIGGRVAARNIIEAKTIGNDSNRVTNLVVGADPSVLETIRTLGKEIKELETSIDGVEKNMSFLAKQTKLTPEHQKLSGQLKLKLSVEKMRCGQKQKQLAELKAQLDDSGCQVLATTVFAGTVVEIGSQRHVVQREEKMCRIYKADGEIWVGSR